MHVMVLAAPGAPFAMQQCDDPIPGDGKIRMQVSACGFAEPTSMSSTRNFPASKKRQRPRGSGNGTLSMRAKSLIILQKPAYRTLIWLPASPTQLQPLRCVPRPRRPNRGSKRPRNHVLSQGHSVIVDAVFARQSKRTAILDVARTLNIPFIGLFLVADLATRMRRVGQCKGDASDATPEIAALQEGYDVGTVDWTRIDASGTPEQTLESGKAELIRRKQPVSG
jgi:hypothetical protein